MRHELAAPFPCACTRWAPCVQGMTKKKTFITPGSSCRGLFHVPTEHILRFSPCLHLARSQQYRPQSQILRKRSAVVLGSGTIPALFHPYQCRLQTQPIKFHSDDVGVTDLPKHIKPGSTPNLTALQDRRLVGLDNRYYSSESEA